MAITKAISANPVRGYYVETINNGRVVQKTGGTGISSFGQPRWGGLQYAIVDGLTGGGTGAGRMQDVQVGFDAEREAELRARVSKSAEKVLVEQHEDFVGERKAAAKSELEAQHKSDDLRKKNAEDAAKEGNKPIPEHKVELVKDPVTGEKKVTAPTTTDASVLDDPRKIAAAEAKTPEQQKKEAGAVSPPATPDKK